MLPLNVPGSASWRGDALCVDVWFIIVCVLQAETKQTGLGVWKGVSEAWRPARLRSSHHSSLTCAVYSVCVNLELCVRVCVLGCKAHAWCLDGSCTRCRIQHPVLSVHFILCALQRFASMPPAASLCATCDLACTGVHAGFLFFFFPFFLRVCVCVHLCLRGLLENVRSCAALVGV